VLGEPIHLHLVFDLEPNRHPYHPVEPRDLIAQLYLMEISYAESFWASRTSPRHSRQRKAEREAVVGEWRHWLNRGGDWPLVPPPMPAVPVRSRVRILQMDLGSPWRLLAEVPPEAWKVGGAGVGAAIATRLRLVTRFVDTLEVLAGTSGRLRNAALEQQLREAETRGLIAGAEQERLRQEDALDDYRRERDDDRRLRLEAGELDLPETPEVEGVALDSGKVGWASPLPPSGEGEDGEPPQLERGSDKPE
jgi:hypothetical protein